MRCAFLQLLNNLLATLSLTLFVFFSIQLFFTDGGWLLDNLFRAHMSLLLGCSLGDGLLSDVRGPIDSLMM